MKLITGPEVKRDGGGAFHPFKKETAAAPASTSSTAENGGRGGDKKEAQRKARRCWSPELHRRFLQALQQLGGSHGMFKHIALQNATAFVLFN